MSILNRRVIPGGIYENITPTNLPEACARVLMAAVTPSRKTRLFVVRFQGETLWLNANRSVYKTKAAAKNAICNWLFSGLTDIIAQAQSLSRSGAADVLCRRAWPNETVETYISWREIERRLLLVIDQLLESGRLEIAEVSGITTNSTAPAPTS